LRNQHSIERIFVKWREKVNLDRVRAGYRQFDVTVPEQTSPQNSWIDSKIRPTEAILDGDFPDRGGAEVRSGLGVLQQAPNVIRESVRVSRGPKQ